MLRLAAGHRVTRYRKSRKFAPAIVVLSFVPFVGLSQETETYTYDALGRLVRVEKSLEDFVRYDYDDAGNRVAKTSQGSSQKEVVLIVYDGITIPIETQP